MGSVILGTNKITDCRILVSINDQPLLQVSFPPIRVSLKLPQNSRSRISFEIVDNVVKEDLAPNPDLHIISGDTNVSIFWKSLLLLSATLLDKETVHLKLDLRPVGIKIFDDPEGLHLGSNLLAHASFSNCMTAISLG